MKITKINATTVTVPLEAPLRHANGCHWGRFVRTIIEVEPDEGITGLGEMGGVAESAEAVFHRDKLGEYNELYKRLDSYPYDQDPIRPGWTPTIPNNRWADPLDARRPENILF